MDMTEHGFELDGIPVTYFKAGSGYPLLLVHGSGPGASSLGYWRAVLGPLSEHFELHVMDLIGFGKSGRKPAQPYFDLELWQRQVEAMLTRIKGESVGLFGHSISATFVLRAAASNSRVASVVTTGAMGAASEPNECTRRVWTAPTNRDELKKTLQATAYDQSMITDAYIAVREPVVFAPGYPEYFNAMFKESASYYINAAIVPDEVLKRVECPVLMIHGRDDVPFPPAVSLDLASRLTDADVMVVARCAHSVAVEAPEKLVDLTTSFFLRHAAKHAA